MEKATSPVSTLRNFCNSNPGVRVAADELASPAEVPYNPPMQKLLKQLALFAFVGSLATSNVFAGDKGFVSLFNGKNLDGWVKRGGKAKYRAENGMIIGNTVPNTPNTFLCTEKDYGDFVLTYEYNVHPQLNSGVQIRSLVKNTPGEIKVGDKTKKIPAGRVHGYQVEIDANNTTRAWMSGIYDEGRRGWLFPGIKGGDKAAFSKQGQRLYKPEQWNSVRVECRGDSIKTWLNGELRADFKDGMTAKGFIGLQVHGVGKNKTPMFAKWRNIKIKVLD